MKRSDAAVSVILIGLAGFILLESRHLSFGTMRVPQTAFFPKILAVLLLIFSGIALLQALLGPQSASRSEPLAAEGWTRIGATLATMVGFAFVLERAGFFLTHLSFDDLAAACDRGSEVVQSHRHRCGDGADLLRHFWLASRYSSPHRHLGNLRWISSPMSRSASRSHSRRQICFFAFSDPWSARWSAYCRAWVQSARSRFCCH